MRFMNFLNQIGKLTAPPIFHAMNLAIFRGYNAAVAFDHCRYLFTLIRMNNKNDFVMSHNFLLGKASHDFHVVRQG